MNYFLLTLSLFSTYVLCRVFETLFTYYLVKYGLKKQRQAIDKEIQRIQKYGEQEGFRVWK